MDEQISIQRERWRERQIGRMTDMEPDGHIDRLKNRKRQMQADGWTDRRTDGWMERQIERPTVGRKSD